MFTKLYCRQNCVCPEMLIKKNPQILIISIITRDIRPRESRWDTLPVLYSTNQTVLLLRTQRSTQGPLQFTHIII